MVHCPVIVVSRALVIFFFLFLFDEIFSFNEVLLAFIISIWIDIIHAFLTASVHLF